MWRWMRSCSGWRVVTLTKPRIGSLFSGYGGLDLAVESFFDAETAWHCEFDDAPARILAHHWPNVPNHRDVTTIDWAEVEPVDIITGGSPCQDLSAAGKRAGMTEGTRSNLWVNMREAINQLRPRLVVWENVRGALSATATSDSDMEPDGGPLGEGLGRAGHLRALGRVLGDLTEIGYDAKWTLIRASDVGAPHHRARIFLVAYPANASSVGLQASRRGSGSAAPLAWAVGGEGALPALNHLPTPNASDSTGGGQTPDKRTGHSRQLIDAVLDLGIAEKRYDHAVPSEGGPSEVLQDMRERVLPEEIQREAGGSNEVPVPEHVWTEVWEQQGSSSSGQPQVEGKEGSSSHEVPGVRIDREAPHSPHRPESGEQRSIEPDVPVRELSSETPLERGPRLSSEEDSRNRFGKYAPAVQRWERVLGRPAPNPTELNRNGKPRLNAEFASFMMGLPAGWVTNVPDITRSQQLKAIGNGVCPQQALAAFSHLFASDGGW